jgi:hypothetical protein
MKLDNAVGVSTSVELVRGLVSLLINPYLPGTHDAAVVVVSEFSRRT